MSLAATGSGFDMTTGKQAYTDYVEAQYVEPAVNKKEPRPTADRIQTRREELEQRLAILDGDASMGDFLLSPEESRERIAIRAELSRLSNEQPKGRSRPKLRLEEDAQGKRAMLGGYQMPDEFIPLLEASPATSPGPQDVRATVESIVGTAIDAALSDCDPRPISAGQYSGCIQSVTDALLSAFPALASAQQEPAPSADAEEKRAPVQGFSAGIPWSMHLRAYDAYCKKWSPQPALIDLEGRNCRGGFGTRELDEFVPGWREEVSEIARLKTRITELEAALRRYAGDGGVTDEQVEAAWAAYVENCIKMSADKAMRFALEAAARAKPSEKGGAR